ncbi:Ly6/PLAUR domain-containing protein 1 [Cricetulus griseus]|uniref:Ly6/PLAUR domain-containing protein 1 n=1 Tax=Cricetulus griseus TaxID=10029 RepID=G3GZF0_CRIGR|nr:Ly6/PLAUR domain-containing protein 1 [Cricetulus griseus]
MWVLGIAATFCGLFWLPDPGNWCRCPLPASGTASPTEDPDAEAKSSCVGLSTVILSSQGVLYASQILTRASEPHFICPAGLALQIQCYQCEEFQLNNDCSSPEFIVNCTVNVQDMCQKEVMEQSAGIMYRKSCASSAACLIASAGYQSFCSPGKLNSVCISCCNTPLCNGPRPKKRGSSASAIRPGLLTTALLFNLALCLAHC